MLIRKLVAMSNNRSAVGAIDEVQFQRRFLIDFELTLENRFPFRVDTILLHWDFFLTSCYGRLMQSRSSSYDGDQDCQRALKLLGYSKNMEKNT